MNREEATHLLLLFLYGSSCMAAASQVFFAIKLSMSRSVWEVVDVLSVAIDVCLHAKG